VRTPGRPAGAGFAIQGTEGLIVGAGRDLSVVGEVEQIESDLGGSHDFGGLADVPGGPAR
jgi:hypothetical protein